MRNAYLRFEQLVKDTSQVDVIYQYMKTIPSPIDTSDLLRWQWVQVVSALDKFIHDLVKIGMIEEFNGIREKTKQFYSFSIDMKTYWDMFNDSVTAVNCFEQKIIECNGYKSFQDPKKIAEALSFIWSEKHKWKVIANQIGIDENDCTKKLNNIVLRRNQIAHEGDYIDIYSKRQEMLERDVVEVKEYILKIGNAIYKLVKI